MLEAAGLTNVVARQLHLETPPSDLTEWKDLISRIATRSKNCTIALVGKYVKLHDAYLSVMESLYHAGFENESKVDIRWVDSELLLDQQRCHDELHEVDGVIIPGGFGDRGIEGMIQAAQYARENGLPCFGICLGMQVIVMEYARNVLGYADANSSEFTPDGAHNVIALMPTSRAHPQGRHHAPGQIPLHHRRGQQDAPVLRQRRDRRGATATATSSTTISAPRCRTRGLTIAGTSPDGRLVEAVELTDRDFYLGVQFHPEFKSRPNRAHPLFKGFIAAALKYQGEMIDKAHARMAEPQEEL